MVNFPSNCNSEASRWSFCTKLNEKLRIWHNETCADKNAEEAESWRKANFYSRISAVMLARNQQIAIARAGNFWNPKIPDHVANGVINYPSGLNPSNEGSRAIFLFGAESELHKLNIDIHSDDMTVVQSEILQAKQDAVNGSFWDSSIEDILSV